MHPFCRSSTIPIIPIGEEVPIETEEQEQPKQEEVKEEQPEVIEQKPEEEPEKEEKAAEQSEIEQESVDNSGGSGIINTKLLKLNSDGTVVSPMNKEKYELMKSKLESRGCTVIPAHGDDRRFLEAFGAEATSDQVGIMHMGDIPSASAFLKK